MSMQAAEDMRLIQFLDDAGDSQVGRVDDERRAWRCCGCALHLGLALRAWQQRVGLAALAQSLPVAGEDRTTPTCSTPAACCHR